jgi:hypothetical protein
MKQKKNMRISMIFTEDEKNLLDISDEQINKKRRREKEKEERNNIRIHAHTYTRGK